MADLPMVANLSYIDPMELVQVLPGKEKFLLHSALVNDDIGRFSFLGSDPFLIFSVKDGKVVVEEKGQMQCYDKEPLLVLRRLLRKYQRPNVSDIPFTGGAVGYFSYDLGWYFEKLPSSTIDDLKLPDLYLPFYDRLIVVDHIKMETLIFSHGFPLVGEEGIKKAGDRLDELVGLINRRSVANPQRKNEAPAGNVTSNFTKENYVKMVEKGKEYIAAGDIFQVNLSQRFQVPISITPWELYQRLADANPAPFASFLDFTPVSVVSSSPERYMRLKGDVVETRPIKGTRPRGANSQEDRRLRQELYKSAKDRAELVMIVDLERNDLGRVCQIGSVKVPQVFRLEEYATVFHLVSTVEGMLLTRLDVNDLVKASFPGGSITGAPKIRAMEIIEELEPTKRSIYTGSIGYIDYSGDADLNIVIRTFLIKNNIAYFQVGGAIVADSDPEAEYQETLDKAKGLINSLGK